MSNDHDERAQRVRSRFWVEAALAVASVALLLVTLIWQDWIELVLGVEPDQGDGSLELLLVTGLVLAASASSVLAGIEWRHTRPVRPRVGNS